ncbi:MAG: hypothetical protein GYB66_09740 [Chloroflexi bacterium]|nr:hypothetical protein [Chloroflexota bacterium]
MSALVVGGLISFLIIGAVIFALIVGSSVALGWLLTLLVGDFSLFEGTLVAMIALICTTLVLANFTGPVPPVGPVLITDTDDELESDGDGWEV